MNKILKSILTTARDIALDTVEKTVPGSALVIDGARRLLDKDESNNGDAVADLGAGVVEAVESLKGDEVIDESLVAEGVLELKSAIQKIRRGIK